MNILRKIQYSQYWNIGFCEQTPEELICNKRLKPIKWLKHFYHDRWFADPFILRVTDSEIVVFVEECPMDNPKGIICELVIDRKTMCLKKRYVMLELDTHLSYPAIIRHEGKVYVYPENGASGKLNIYEYDEVNHKLINPTCILDEAVADATIVEHKGRYYLSATQFPDTQKNAYLYSAESFWGPFKRITEQPYQTDKKQSRQGGNFFEVYGCLYRPAQNCEIRYGAGLSIMNSNYTSTINEKLVCQLMPTNKRYKLGLHTINFHNGLCVIDGYGLYKYILGNIYYFIRRKLCFYNLIV